tara:strand:- start:141 stop:362 length:222 start_codon:yes stop_codon:yes gene_type:complete
MSDIVKIEAGDLKALAEEVIDYHQDGYYPLDDRSTVDHLARITKALLSADIALGKTILKDRIPRVDNIPEVNE